jgi:hypothetical protein
MEKVVAHVEFGEIDGDFEAGEVGRPALRSQQRDCEVGTRAQESEP